MHIWSQMRIWVYLELRILAEDIGKNLRLEN